MVPALAVVADVWVSPGEHQYVKQGDKLKYTAGWWSDVEVVKIQWTMDGEVVWEKNVNGKKTSGISYYTLYARDFPVKPNNDGSYEIGCILYGMNGPVEEGYDYAVVYIQPRTP